MKLTADSLPTHLKQQLLPAYLVSGDDPLLTAEAADTIRARAREAGFTEREVHFIERVAGWEAVRASAGALSLFASRRILEIRLPTGKPGVEGGKAIRQLLSINDPDMLVLILTGKLDRDAQNAEWVRAVESQGGWVQVWPIGPDKLTAWLAGRCKRAGLEAEPAALELLAERTEGNLLAAHQEIEKLKLLSGSQRLTAAAVLDGVADSARFNVFQLTDAILAGDAAHALRMLGGLRAEDAELPLVLWACNKALRDMWATQAPASGESRGGWQRPSPALDKARRRAPRLPYTRLTARAARADRMAKGQLRGDAWDELAILIAELCGQSVFRGTAVSAGA